ncbi:hypothetical protein [Hymenobacter sp. DG01]|uniref:hypothetical protein n=1 Tax=Hymenobacter sp. DG01 TaxID=2584940 RepID=UPI00112071FA|nr:hypothetical protein [Hymenobacter sp. DG01]
MNATLFSDQNKTLRKRFEAAMNEPDNDRYIIYDGPVNVERYLDSDIKIAWLLKEPYDETDGTGGGWCFTDLFDKDDLYNCNLKEAHRATWHPVVYTTYGIQNGFMRWDDMNFIRNQPEMCDVLRSIAIVNAQKLPSLGHAYTQYAHIQNSYDKHQALLHEQIDLLNADIHIFASTLSLYKKALGLDTVQPVHKASLVYYIKDDKLYIETYHPAQTSVKREVYVDDIIAAAEEWSALRLNQAQV